MAEKEQGLTLEDLDNHVEDLYEAMSLDDWMAPAKEVHNRMDELVKRFVGTFGVTKRENLP